MLRTAYDYLCGALQDLLGGFSLKFLGSTAVGVAYRDCKLWSDKGRPA